MALAGIKVLELAGLAPAPFAGMVLSDFGAQVTRVDKITNFSMDTLARGKRSVCINLRNGEGQSVLRRLSSKSDVLIEPFRPGVMEKLNLGPNKLLADNPRLIYVRLSGYGQHGPYKMKAGHDINYIATSGVLGMLKRRNEKPQAPVNLVADFAGGGLLAALGVVTALFEREKSGKGQVIDANMVEGAAYVSSFLFAHRQLFSESPGENTLDTGAPFYDTYQTRDDKYVSVGAIEPQFYQALTKALGFDTDNLPHQMDQDKWPEMKQKFANKIAQHTRDEICEICKYSDTCVMPVLSYDEVHHDVHNKENKSFFRDAEGKHIPVPAPRLSRTPAVADAGPQPIVGGHTRQVLLECGLSEAEIDDLVAQGAVGAANTQSKL